jgi:membrane-bound lytic murein transglycosylase A
MAQRRSFPPILAALILIGLALASVIWWYLSQQPPTKVFLTQVSFHDLSGWADSDPRPALKAFHASCENLAHQSPDQSMGGSGYAGTVADWLPLCDGLRDVSSAGEARNWFENRFVPFEVAVGLGQSGLFTGYYEPELRGSRASHGSFRTPVYGMPDDLIDVDLGQFRDALRGEKIAGRLDGHKLVPYPTRADIDRDGLRTAPILFYGDDPVAVFFLHIQGSGRVHYDDGRIARVAYASQNGRSYTSIGRAMIEEGDLPQEKMSMQAIRKWMDDHPKDARRIMEKDESFVFFKELPLGDPELGSPGAEGVPLTPGASLAVDLRLHALGVPMFVDASAPDSDPAAPQQVLQRLFIAQDTGGAIRGPVRGDVYFGFGRDAGLIAGRMKSHGRMYVLLPKAIASHAAASNS